MMTARTRAIRKRKPALCEDPARKLELVDSITAWMWGEARRFATINKVDIDDVFLEGRYHALRAAELFDPSRGISFLTFASRTLRSRMYQEAQALSSPVHVPRHLDHTHRRHGISLDAPAYAPRPGDNAPSLAEAMPCPRSVVLEQESHTAQLMEHVSKALHTLGERERYVIEQRFLHGRKLEELGLELGVSRERIRQIQIMALNALRSHKDVRKLKEAA